MDNSNKSAYHQHHYYASSDWTVYSFVLMLTFARSTTIDVISKREWRTVVYSRYEKRAGPCAPVRAANRFKRLYWRTFVSAGVRGDGSLPDITEKNR